MIEIFLKKGGKEERINKNISKISWELIFAPVPIENKI